MCRSRKGGEKAYIEYQEDRTNKAEIDFRNVVETAAKMTVVCLCNKKKKAGPGGGAGGERRQRATRPPLTP